MTNLQKIQALAWGSFWSALGGLTFGGAEILVQLSEPIIVWKHVFKIAGVGMMGGIILYWKQQTALFTPSPVMIEDTRQIVRTPPGQADLIIDTHKETQTVQPPEATATLK